MSKAGLPTEFGVFYPNGYIVAAFPQQEAAQQVQRDLFTGGYDQADCRLATSENVIRSAQSHLKNASWLKGLGKSGDLEQQHLEAAKRGCTFLVVYAPTKLDTERAMNVIRRVPFELAHRYHYLAIQSFE